jgi:hypothetical protein
MSKPQTYIGIDQDLHGGMTVIGKMVRDAWVFGLIPETETCAGWNLSRIDGLLQRVNDEWDKYGCLVSHLPEELRARHQRIHGEAMERAREAGWSGEVETDDEA